LFFSSRRRHTRFKCDWSSDVCSSDLMARERLSAAGTESELPEIQAWRRTFSALGLKPTQYRCASESLLRRFRKEGSLPAIHPLRSEERRVGREGRSRWAPGGQPKVSS